MHRSGQFVRRLTASLSVLGLGAGLIVTVAGTAQAAVPDHWGFAFVSSPGAPGTPPLTHQHGSWPAPLKVTTMPGAVGQVFVRFPAIAAKGGVVHVTAVSSRPVWCQAQKWGPSGPAEVASVRCFKAGGAPTFAPFTILFTTSSPGAFPPGRAYGYARFEPGHGLIARFNSAGAANAVAQLGTGVWRLVMPGVGTAALAGGVQVTAVDPAKPARCELSGWKPAAAQQVFTVRCFNAGTAPVNTGWTLSYQRGRSIAGTEPKLFGYTFDNKPAVAGPYAPAPPAVSFSSAGGTNTILRSGAGLRLITFPRVGALPDTVLVTAFGAGPGFCNLLSPWATNGSTHLVTVRDVACYTAAGKPQNLRSLVSYASAL